MPTKYELLVSALNAYINNPNKETMRKVRTEFSFGHCPLATDHWCLECPFYSIYCPMNREGAVEFLSEGQVVLAAISALAMLKVKYER